MTEAPFTLARNNGEKMEVALQWTESTDEAIRSYVNGIRTSAGGTHENGFKSGIAKAIRNYMETHEVKTKGLTITAEDIREGIVAHPVGVRARADVPGTDQGETEQSGDDGDGRWLRSSGAGIVAQRQHDGGGSDCRPDRAGRQGPAGLARGRQRGQAQVGDAAASQPARQARRLQSDRVSTNPNCSSSRAIPPAVRPSRAATTTRRPCCRCAARSSTPRVWR